VSGLRTCCYSRRRTWPGPGSSGAPGHPRRQSTTRRPARGTRPRVRGEGMIGQLEAVRGRAGGGGRLPRPRRQARTTPL
jgi:hypothetical protein